MYLHPEGGEKRRGPMPLGLFLFLLFSIFLVVTCPRPPVFARPNVLVASFATQARACILSDHTIFYTPRGGGNGGVMPLGLFLLKYVPCSKMVAKWRDAFFILIYPAHAQTKCPRVTQATHQNFHELGGTLGKIQAFKF